MGHLRNIKNKIIYYSIAIIHRNISELSVKQLKLFQFLLCFINYNLEFTLAEFAE